MAKFNIANVLAVMEGLGAAKNANAMRQQEAQQQFQGQALQLVPQLMRAQQQQRQSTLAPYQTAFDAAETPGSKATAFAALQQAMQGLGPEPDPGSFLAPVLNWRGKGAITFPGFAGPQGGMPALPQPEFRDPREEEARRFEADLLGHDLKSRVNPAQGLPLVGAIRRGENIHAPVRDPRSAEPTIDTPDGPSLYQQAIANNPTTAEAAAAERVKLEGERQKGREALARQKAEAAAEALGLKLGSSERIAYVRVYSPAYNNALSETGDEGLARQIAERAAQGAFSKAPGRTPGQEVLAAPDPTAPALPELSLPKFETRKQAQTRLGQQNADTAAFNADTRASRVTNQNKNDDKKVGILQQNADTNVKRAEAYVNQVTKNLDPKYVGGQAWFRQNTIAARNNTERRLAAAGVDGDGTAAPGIKWNPALTGRKDALQREVVAAETALGKLITKYGEDSETRAKAKGGKDPAGERWDLLNLDSVKDQLGKDIAAGRTVPNLKKKGKTVPNPTAERHRVVNELYKQVKAKRRALNEFIDTYTPKPPEALQPGGKGRAPELPADVSGVTIRPAVKEPQAFRATKPGQVVQIEVGRDLKRAEKLLKRPLTEAERNAVSRATRAEFAN